MLAEEREYLAPGIHRLFGAIKRSVPVIEAVTRTVVAMEFVVLAMLLQRGFVLVHLLGARRAVVVAEDAEQRTGETLRHVDRCDRRLGVELLLAHHDAPAPHVDGGIDVLPLARIDERV